MAQITNLILFISKFSERSKHCVEFAIRNKLPVEFIELDSEESRNYASTCKVRIVDVPSLVLILSNGDTSLYIGAPKIMNWFKTLIEQNTQHQPSHIQPQHQPSHIQNNHTTNEIMARMLSAQSGRQQFQESEESSEYEETKLNFSDEESTPIPTAITNSTSVGLSTINVNKPSNTDIMNKAKQMMKEREETLGVKSDGT